MLVKSYLTLESSESSSVVVADDAVVKSPESSSVDEVVVLFIGFFASDKVDKPTTSRSSKIRENSIIEVSATNF